MGNQPSEASDVPPSRIGKLRSNPGLGAAQAYGRQGRRISIRIRLIAERAERGRSRRHPYAAGDCSKLQLSGWLGA